MGEPSRGKPNHLSEGRDIDLKKSKIWVTVSTQMVNRDPDLGDAPYLPVDIKVPMDYKAYSEGKDLALEAALKAALKGSN